MPSVSKGCFDGPIKRQAKLKLYNSSVFLTVKNTERKGSPIPAPLFAAGDRELFAAGEKAFSAFLTLLTVFAKTVPPILIAGLAAAAGAWVVNHVQM